MRGKRKRPRDLPASPETARREALERKWWSRATREDSLATLVTAESARHEPFHRWHHYMQSFAPSLVRHFLSETAEIRNQLAGLPVLDPFCGAGTVPVECARQGVGAIGIDAAEPLVFLSEAKFARSFPPFPAFGELTAWTSLADELEHPVHRAALMLAVGRQHTSAGKVNRGAMPLAALLAEIVETMQTDLLRPIALENPIYHGDATALTEIEDQSIGGIFTSPPYLSRHEYGAILKPMETVYRHWYDTAQGETGQLPASPRAKNKRGRMGSVPAVDESAARLEEKGERRMAGVVREYFAQMESVLSEFRRVLAPSAPCWMVVGGARWKDVYIPADFIIADIAESVGLQITEIRVARDLIDGRRKFGNVGHVAPRESVLEMVLADDRAPELD